MFMPVKAASGGKNAPPKDKKDMLKRRASEASGISRRGSSSMLYSGYRNTSIDYSGLDLDCPLLGSRNPKEGEAKRPPSSAKGKWKWLFQKAATLKDEPALASIKEGVPDKDGQERIASSKSAPKTTRELLWSIAKAEMARQKANDKEQREEKSKEEKAGAPAEAAASAPSSGGSKLMSVFRKRALEAAAQNKRTAEGNKTATRKVDSNITVKADICPNQPKSDISASSTTSLNSQKDGDGAVSGPDTHQRRERSTSHGRRKSSARPADGTPEEGHHGHHGSHTRRRSSARAADDIVHRKEEKLRPHSHRRSSATRSSEDLSSDSMEQLPTGHGRQRAGSSERPAPEDVGRLNLCTQRQFSGRSTEEILVEEPDEEKTLLPSVPSKCLPPVTQAVHTHKAVGSLSSSISKDSTLIRRASDSDMPKVSTSESQPIPTPGKAQRRKLRRAKTTIDETMLQNLNIREIAGQESQGKTGAGVTSTDTEEFSLMEDEKVLTQKHEQNIEEDTLKTTAAAESSSSQSGPVETGSMETTEHLADTPDRVSAGSPGIAITESAPSSLPPTSDHEMPKAAILKDKQQVVVNASRCANPVPIEPYMVTSSGTHSTVSVISSATQTVESDYGLRTLPPHDAATCTSSTTDSSSQYLQYVPTLGYPDQSGVTTKHAHTVSTDTHSSTITGSPKVCHCKKRKKKPLLLKYSRGIPPVTDSGPTSAPLFSRTAATAAMHTYQADLPGSAPVYPTSAPPFFHHWDPSVMPAYHSQIGMAVPNVGIPPPNMYHQPGVQMHPYPPPAYIQSSYASSIPWNAAGPQHLSSASPSDPRTLLPGPIPPPSSSITTLSTSDPRYQVPARMESLPPDPISKEELVESGLVSRKEYAESLSQTLASKDLKPSDVTAEAVGSDVTPSSPSRVKVVFVVTV